MTPTDSPAADKKRELALFLFLTIVLAPAVSVAVIGGYGLFIWLSQMLA
ncbi:MAG: periplasmic nitrate reductase, NapE protein [Pseudomonadota bacterium]|nr:periplasmic nitrate reductase, NapE protein [Pseudomonadota bacterium]